MVQSGDTDKDIPPQFRLLLRALFKCFFLSSLVDFVKERRQIVKLCRVKVSRRGNTTTTSRLQRRSFASHLLTGKEKGCGDNKQTVFWPHPFDVRINKLCF